jgi:hypothetical protein
LTVLLDPSSIRVKRGTEIKIWVKGWQGAEDILEREILKRKL